MKTIKLDKWQRIQYMLNMPLGENRQYVTACQEHIDLTREAACEGMVLLKNDGGLLPFAKGAKLAVFGKAQADYVKGGGGSGDVSTPYIRTLQDGFAEKQAQGKVEVFAPLTDYYYDYVKEQYAAKAQPGWVKEPVLPEELTKAAREFTDMAVVVISRYSKENADRTGAPNDGDFYLSVEEEAMVQQVKSAFDKIVVVLNTGGMMDTLWFKDEQKIPAALLAWQPGMVGGLAMADILCGDACPSGRLTDTFAVDFDAYPSSANFNESDLYVEYDEDIFVGYRYFETIPGAAQKVCYPFGYGLSYTTFAFDGEKLSVDGDKLKLTVRVTNTGAVAGKQVMQLYCEAPQGKLGKASRVLVGFAKTELLQPGQSQTVNVEFGVDKLASYDDVGAVSANAWVLEAGSYRFWLGEDVRAARCIADTYEVAEDTVVEQLSAKCVPHNLTRRMKADGTYEITGMPKAERQPFGFENDPTLPVHSLKNPPHEAFWKVTRQPNNVPVYHQLMEVYEGKVTLDELMEDMSDEHMIHLCCGQPNRGPSNTFGWGNLPDFGVPNALTADGPAGLRFRSFINVKTTAFPCATLLACTWNTDLVYRVGEAGAREVKENSMATWLTPACNIHRSPLCGRNFEYYSEDPVLSGAMAAAMTKGIQSLGIAVSLKHFCCNNKEVNRKNSDSIVSQRALREIYLKAFEICVKEADPWTIMSSYNLMNGKHTSSNRELLTDILRGEWGWNGLVTTDWYTYEQQYKEIAAGNDVKMGTGMPEHTYEMLKAGKLRRKDLRASAKRVLELILKMD